MIKSNFSLIRPVLPIAILFALFGCNNSKPTSKEEVKSDTVQSDTIVQAAVVLKDSTNQRIYTSYISLKNALVKSDAAAARSAATELTGYLNAVDLKKTVKPAQLIAGSEDIKAQRRAFTALSNDLIGVFKGATLTQGKIYVQHCPMANNGDGGDWLSSEKKIQNPYYGDEMLECGAVLEEIKVK